MAAWLAYLKSRLLLPEPPADDDEPSGAELAAALSHRLQLLEAMQRAGAALMARPQLGRDVFLRGAPEGIPRSTGRSTGSSLYELLSGLWRGPPPPHSAGADHRAADVPLARRGAAAPRAIRRPVPEWRELAAFCRRSCAAAVPPLGARRDLRRDCWSWRAPAASSCARTAPSARSICAASRQARRARRVGRDERAAGTSCGCSRRCCSPRRSRSPRTSWRGCSAPRPMSRRCCASWPRPMPGAASTWCGWPAAGRSAPRPTRRRSCERARRSRASCRAPRSRRWRSSPITSR